MAAGLLSALGAFGQPPDSTNGWGYGYDSLLQDLQRWRQNPLLQVDSFGASVQNRALWMVTLREGSEEGKQRVFVHARTHPGEVQAFYIAREMMNFLADTAAQVRTIRESYVFHFVPMYNPDGVELGYGRLNANRVDIESNWDKPVLEPEVQALRAKFQELMAKPNPIRVALNLHSDRFNCTRFFFYHEASGTSQLFAQLEQEYITRVRSHFVEGIETWDFVRSWNGNTPTQYPESWWWLNHRESVMALTYEDANCPDAGQFDRAARALVLGTVDYISGHPNAIRFAGRARSGPGYRKPGSLPVFAVRREAMTQYFDAQGRLRASERPAP
jgi:hypothetical protein